MRSTPVVNIANVALIASLPDRGVDRDVVVDRVVGEVVDDLVDARTLSPVVAEPPNQINRVAHGDRR